MADVEISDEIYQHFDSIQPDQMMHPRFVNALLYAVNSVLHKTLGNAAAAVNQRLVNELGVEVIHIACPPDEVERLEHDGEAHDHETADKLMAAAIEIVVNEMHLAHDIDMIASECDETGNETREFEVHGCAFSPQAKVLEGHEQLCAICPLALIAGVIIRNALQHKVRMVVREKKAGGACDIQMIFHP